MALRLEPEGLLWVPARIFTLSEPWETPSTPFHSGSNCHDPYPKEIWGQSWMPAIKLVLSLKGLRECVTWCGDVGVTAPP